MKWDSASVKSQLRQTSQRLGQAQAKNDSQASITRTDIATLIQRGNVSLAREKAEKLITDEAYNDLLEELEMQIGVLLEYFHELERGGNLMSPVLVEAASTIIYASPYIYSKDLDAIRTILVDHLGPHFAHSAAGNRDHHVPSRVLEHIFTPVPSASQLDAYLRDIADGYGVVWSPGHARQDLVNILSEYLDPAADPEVDILQLRKLCLRGIPDEPIWLRPRIWKLLLGTLPKIKSSWKVDAAKQRDAYYDLVRRLLQPFSEPSEVPALNDDNLLNAYKQLSGLSRDVFALLEDEPESFKQCPLHEASPEAIRIPFAGALEARLQLLQTQEKEGMELLPTPEIRLEPGVDITPGISLTPSDSNSNDSETPNASRTLLPSRRRIFGDAHPVHCASLLRLLYLHNAINPGNFAYHAPSFMVPLYSVLMQEVDVEDLAHLEADTFWLLEAMVAEFSGLEDEGGNVWMKLFSERVAWADFDLSIDLERRGLDPALPHYSYRWLMPVLTHTLPLSSLFLVWDMLFSSPERERDASPKIESLVDICTSMLLRAKNHLSRLGNARQGTHSLWTNDVDHSYRPQASPSPLNGNDAFMEALSFLQVYNLKYVGGVERILQTAFELSQRREKEALPSAYPPVSLANQLRANIWKGFSLQQPSPSKLVPPLPKPSGDHDLNDGSDTDTSAGTSYQSTFTSQITTSLWRGITNQTAMEGSPSPPPSPDPATHVATDQDHNAQAVSSIWGYAEKLKDSDAVASLSKVSSNWRAKGLLSSWGISASPPTGAPELKANSTPGTFESVARRGSLAISPPRIFSPPPADPSFPKKPEDFSAPNNKGLMEKTKSLISIVSPPASATKSAPKPLLLNSSSSVVSGLKTSNGHPRSASAGDMSMPDTDEWADVMRLKRQHFHRDSQSSISSLSPSDILGRGMKSSRSDRDSDTGGSRIVALNRRSISPMAPNFRVTPSRPSSRNSSISSDIHSPPLHTKSPLQLSSSRDYLPPTLGLATHSSSGQIITSPPGTSSTMASFSSRETEDSDTTSNELPSSKKPSWKKSIERTDSEDTHNSGPIGALGRSPRLRSKRHPRPANLQIHDTQRARIAAEQKTPSPSNLTVEWPIDDQDSVTTPKAGSFDSDDYISVSSGTMKSPRRSRKISSNGQDRLPKNSSELEDERRTRKIPTLHRTRKVSTESRDVPKGRRESAAEEGDDEGYDDLLSAYESEDGPTNF